MRGKDVHFTLIHFHFLFLHKFFISSDQQEELEAQLIQNILADFKKYIDDRINNVNLLWNTNTLHPKHHTN